MHYLKYHKLKFGLRKAMTHFRYFVSRKCKFLQIEMLEDTLNISKVVIIDAIKMTSRFQILENSIALDQNNRTRFQLFLDVEYFACNSSTSDFCATDGKVPVSKENNYTATDGETFGIAWSLEQMKYFTKKLKHRICITSDHKQLIKTFSDGVF